MPEQFGHYSLLEELGRGGFGIVYRARDDRTGRLVALKRMQPGVKDNPEQKARFEREMQIAQSLKHNHIVGCWEVGTEKGLSYLAMEMLTGENLADIVKRNGPLPVAEACTYVREAALGLQHAHDRKLVHRDVKPSNLLVEPSQQAASGCRGIVKVLDMGLARYVAAPENAEEPPKEALTQYGQELGTPDYVSPEQILDSRSVDPRADVYSLGATLYYLLSGKTPFHEERNPALKYVAIMNKEPPLLRKLRPEVPAAVQEVVNGALRKDPAKRYQSAAALADALRPFCAAGGSTATSPSSAGTGAAQATSGGSRLWLWVVAVVSLVAVAAGAVWFALH